MTKDENTPKASDIRNVREIIRASLTSSLASLEADAQGPAVSLAVHASSFSARPIFLLSDLALHSRNIKADDRVAVLFDDRMSHDNPLEAMRVSLKGHMRVLTEKPIISRYLRRHQEAQDYAGFGDFNFYILQPDSAYVVGGFGKIYTLEAHDLLLEDDLAPQLTEAEEELLIDINADHKTAIANFASQAGMSDSKDWIVTGIDPEGFDLRSKKQAFRVRFDQLVTKPDDALRILLQKAKI